MKVWKCEIGTLEDIEIPEGADYPMRVAIQIAYKMVTGKEAQACFSGWGEKFTPSQIQVIKAKGR